MDGSVKKSLAAILVLFLTLACYGGVTSLMQMVVARKNVAAGGFSPSDIASIHAWYDAGIGVTTNASDVTLWEDQAGTNDLSQSTQSLMPDSSASAAAFNNEEIVTFDSTDDYLKTIAFAALSQPNTIFHVASWTSETAFHYDGIASGSRHAFFQNGSGNWNMFAGDNAVDGAASTNVHVFGTLWSGASSALYIDGGTNAISSGAGGTHTLTGITLGTGYNQSSPGGMVLAEFIIYDALLTDAEMNDVGNYLATKYGTTWTDL